MELLSLGTASVSTSAAVPIDEVLVLCRRLRLKYFREQLEEVVLTARAQAGTHRRAQRLAAGRGWGPGRSTIEVRRRACFPASKTFDTWVGGESLIDPAGRFSGPCACLNRPRRQENPVVAGPSGTGKSHLLKVLGHTAIDAQLTAARSGVEDLGALVRGSRRVDDTISKSSQPSPMSRSSSSTTSGSSHLRRCRLRRRADRQGGAWPATGIATNRSNSGPSR